MSLKELTAALYRIEKRQVEFENLLYNKLKVSKVIDISDDKVHIVKQIVNTWETPDGVIIHIK